MYKIGIIGDRDSVLGFMALGYAVHEAQNASDAAQRLHSLVKSEEYAVIFMTEELCAALPEELARYKDVPLPVITAIPGKNGSIGYGMTALKHATERAVGTDILFQE